MDVFIQTVVDLVAAHRQLAYALVLVIAMVESLPIIGLFIPGTAMILAISALVPSGAVALWPLIAAAVAGAIIGDGVSYWLGARYHEPIKAAWPLSRYPEVIAKGEALFQRHGAKSVFLARFTPAVRAVVPLIAGIVRMPARRFYIVNIWSACIWGPAHILPGVLIGASLAVVGAVAGRLLVFLLVVAAVLAAFVLAVRLALRHGVPLAARVQDRLFVWAAAGATRHGSPGGWMRRQLATLLDPAQREFRALTVAALVLAVGVWLLVGLLVEAITGEPLLIADSAVVNALAALRTDWADRVTVAIYQLGETGVLLSLTGLVAAWLAWRRAWRLVLYWLGAAGVAVLFFAAVQAVLPAAGRGIPAGGWIGGNIALVATLYLFLAVIIARELPAALRGAAIGVAALAVGAVALSRLYLRLDAFSTLAVGLVFALSWVALLTIVYLRHNPRRIGGARLAAVALMTLAVALTASIDRSYRADLAALGMPAVPPREMRVAGWWQGAWQSLPVRRADIGGREREPITLQWAGDLGALADRLERAGWRRPAHWNLAGVLAWLDGRPDPLALPVLPELQDGRGARLVMVRPTPGGRLVVRLWLSDVVLRDSEGLSAPLWIGSVVAQRFVRPLGLMTLTLRRADVDPPRAVLARALPGARLVLGGARDDDLDDGTPMVRDPDWDGRVLLGHDPGISTGGQP